MKLLPLLAHFLPLVDALATRGQGGGQDPEAVAARRILTLQSQYQKKILDTIKPRKAGCTTSTILRRKEWGALTKKERLNYIDAVYCLASKPAKSPASLLPGARSLFDDYVGSHALRSIYVHADGNFLGFHRRFLHLYEKALREECGYKGAQPYWDWTQSYQDPRNASVLDGSPWSLGSNGVFIPNRGPTIVNVPVGDPIPFAPATGGGCVASGPFTPDKWQIHLGPVSYAPQGPQGGYGYNPRCLSRDLSPIFSKNLRPTNVSKLLDGAADLGAFNLELDAAPGGVHGNGHFQMGTVALDVYTSPNDPIFWLHHAQVDRLWAIWQNLAPNRTYQVWGTGTNFNSPPSPNVTLDSLIDFGGVISAPKPIREVVSTIDDVHCFIYE
ncbi:hypothetical protein B0T22DRAFT_480684 [Podospora appendiculata]|uniref:Tyrosinase copper-binding domain-containing protein n=1 Tax=Podospora appendiculata TaxID=314037 RepID=A0AAE0XC28_9PEZI|nr:hypothetical protein B0T22DRAFT_480684 [Podospora appendiculata]